jgi:hypothetical protein
MSLNLNPIKTKKLIVTIQENQAEVFEYTDGKLLFNSTIDNDRTVSTEEGGNTWQTFPTGRGKIVGGNEGQWKSEVDKHIMKNTFEALVQLYRKPEIKTFSDLVIFYSSNIEKEELEEEIKTFKANHPGVEVQSHNKNLHGHEMVLTGVKKLG